MGCIGLFRKGTSSKMPNLVGTASTQKHGWATLKRLAEFTTMISPAFNALHTNRNRTVSDVNGNNGGETKNIDFSISTAPESSFDLPLFMDAVKHHLERVYADLRGRDAELSRENMEEFLREVQGTAIIEPPLERETYTPEQFLEVWYFYCRLATRPVKSEEKDLSKPISNYFISSSHNTYLWGNQLNGENTAEAYRTVLNNDCRCIEIDVWNGAGFKEEAPGARTQNRSKSPYGHRRHYSSSSLPGSAYSLIGTPEQRSYELLGSSRNHSPEISRPGHGPSPETKRPGPSASQPILGLGLDLPAAAASTSQVDQMDHLDPGDFIGEPLSRARSLGQVWHEHQEELQEARSRSRSRSSLLRKMEPQVMHAHTFQLAVLQLAKDVHAHPPIPFRDVCQAIKETAFEKNDLPIIVSLEVHATGEQQDMMVDIMKEEWGDMLLDQAFDECDPKQRQPRLEELKRKILVKVKKTPPGAPPKGSSTQLLVPPTPSIHGEDASGSDDEDPAPSRKTLIREALGKLAIYTHSEHYEDFTKPAAKTLSHIFSIDEDKILKLHQTMHKEMFVHNRNFFMRAYPHKRRIDSSNLDPSLYWRKGVQMVALNWQMWDEGMMLNHAMFESERGWVLKPQGYLGSDKSTSQAEAIKHRTLDLKITILAGQHLPTSGTSSRDDSTTDDSSSDEDGSNLRPLVKCELHVERPEERAEKKLIKDGYAQEGLFKQFTKSAETEHPDWGAHGFLLDFSSISNVVEELSFVRFKIENKQSIIGLPAELVAWACIRLDRLQQGYRFISLMDVHGKPTDGQLLVKIEKKVR